ncbi:ATP-binding protein [Nocardioides sp. GY 10113]|uniref:ATP-binding protein n=1 Tax=Nocardioides sp. GY 10113 TaxID=2569761 RepID=UPI0010A87AE4|nr:ATP-binding protein [Nocardioides sp. GY 10113]TIC88347.1 ATP-binding protein [Nocardioides sp. GY 10113]
MPYRQALNLEPGPRSAQEARRWAIARCRDLGREDLCECAELAISELVTNAVLHGEPPMVIRLRGTREHPRFEVRDASVIPPQPIQPGGTHEHGHLVLDDLVDGLDDEQLVSLLTVGRGLDIVARASLAWGTEVEEDGKIVWFEPASELAEEAGADYQLTRSAPPPDIDDTRADQIAVQVQGVPIEAFERFQDHFLDLRREIRLLALAHQDDYPLAKVLSEHFDALETPLRANMGREQVAAARESGDPTIDLRLRMAPETARQIGGLIDLMDASDDFSRAQRLLTAPRTSDQRAFQIWFLGEFRRQAAGATPVPWAQQTQP